MEMSEFAKNLARIFGERAGSINTVSEEDLEVRGGFLYDRLGIGYFNPEKTFWRKVRKRAKELGSDCYFSLPETSRETEKVECMCCGDLMEVRSTRVSGKVVYYSYSDAA